MKPMNNFEKKYQFYLQMVNQSLEGEVPIPPVPEKKIYEALNYSLLAGGKRIRPILALGVGEALGADLKDCLAFGVPLEMIHTYSLIHDDLPAMDNDDFRRGVPTSHRKFGEALAILTGDMLLNLAFERMIDACFSINPIKRGLEVMGIIARAAGHKGMIGGQVLDLSYQKGIVDEDQLTRMHRKKTGALIGAACIYPAILAGSDDGTKENLKRYGDLIGLAFQVKDDILDHTGDFSKLGKKTGGDAMGGKATYVALYGLEGAKGKLSGLIDDAVGQIGFLGDKGRFLTDFALYMGARNN